MHRMRLHVISRLADLLVYSDNYMLQLQQYNASYAMLIPNRTLHIFGWLSFKSHISGIWLVGLKCVFEGDICELPLQTWN